MNRKQIVWVATGLLATVACQNEDNLPAGNQYPADGLVRITTEVLPPATRAGGQYTAYTGTTLGLSLDYGQGAPATATDIRWNRDATIGTWSQDAMTAPMQWRDATTPVSVYAYAPYEGGTLEAGGVLKFKVSNVQNYDGYLTSDLVTWTDAAFTPGTNLSQQALPIRFEHRMARIDIEYILGGDYSVLNSEVGSTNAQLLEASPEVTYDMKDGSLSAGGDKVGIVGAKNGPLGTTFIIPPQTFPKDSKRMEIEITHKNSALVSLSYTPLADLVFESGIRYTLHLRVGKEKVTLAEITASPWDDNGGAGYEIPGGEAK